MAEHANQHDAQADAQMLARASGRIRLKIGAAAPAPQSAQAPAELAAAPKRGTPAPPALKPVTADGR